MEKGTVIKARLSFIEKRWGQAAYNEANSLISARCGSSGILPSQWYPTDIAVELAGLVARLSHSDKAFFLKSMGCFVAESTLQGAYAGFLKKNDPDQTAKTIPVLFSSLWSNVPFSTIKKDAGEYEFRITASTLTYSDSMFFAGFLESVMSLTGLPNIKSGIIDDKSRSLLIVTISSDAKKKKLAPVEIPIENEQQIMDARKNAKLFAETMGFGLVDQTMVVTCISELARNIVSYAGKGYIRLEDSMKGNSRCLLIKSVDNGPGIKNLQDIMEGSYKSEKGLGMGLRALKKLTHEMNVISGDGQGTIIDLVCYLNR